MSAAIEGREGHLVAIYSRIIKRQERRLGLLWCVFHLRRTIEEVLRPSLIILALSKWGWLRRFIGF